ncbi:hypothetical protein [Natrinema altunense]|uniref:Lipoprotein n=1 Tax=Natrinema altunense (strain JCM 12890 / CGMCC 1.3731 / AJ2) TaxID=1227494 RepID=M0A3R4_NATA2|nr:hypothetical protein [Natrinema altunense]ELY91983.1 hypothetical protein C485_00530 [Natrinema altunense JCM 12890]
MNKKQLILIFAVVGMVTLAGCGVFGNDTSSGDESADDLASDTNTERSTDYGGSYLYEIGVTEANQQGLIRSQPPFKMDNSLERQNLIDRYKYLNDRNNVHHVYLMSHDGKVVSYYTAQGKVSSVNSKLTNDRQLVKVPDAKYDEGNGAAGPSGPNWKLVESPQMDGSYGSNGDAIFFFTTDGHYVEWNGLYVVSEEPKNIQTPVTLTDEVDENESEN